ncbi:MAG: hypothetical protein LBV12_08735 [Puniceicoccales bacterium]|nr:hypothetical protein [Puniceicoccales bacterium]
MRPHPQTKSKIRITTLATDSANYLANVGLLGIVGLSLLILINPSRAQTIGLINISLTSLWLLWKTIVAIYLKHSPWIK